MLRPMFVNSVWNPSIFDDFFNDDLFSLNQSQSTMKTDVKELDDSYEVAMELPGYDKSDIHAELNDGYLTIKASHSTDKDEKKDNYIRKERYVGECSRSFYIGTEVKQEDIQAAFKNGILTLRFPKIEENKKIEQKQLISIE